VEKTRDALVLSPESKQADERKTNMAQRERERWMKMKMQRDMIGGKGKQRANTTRKESSV
jgi:hypothetical protein